MTDVSDEELVEISARLARGEARLADSIALMRKVSSLERGALKRLESDPRILPTGEHFKVLLDAIMLVRDIGAAPPSMQSIAQQVAMMSLARWASNTQAFLMLLKAPLPTEAYGVARMGSELTINLNWILQGRAASDRFPSADERAQALISDALYMTRKWFDEMQKQGIRVWDTANAELTAEVRAAQNPSLPNVEQRANASAGTKALYAFAYRGESGSVHSSMRVLAKHAEGVTPLPERVMAQNVLLSSLLLFDAAEQLLKDERLRPAALAIEREIKRARA